MDKNEKAEEVQFLTDCFKKSQIAICADYRGLTVAQITNLRSELRKAKCGARVVKNTLAKLSIEKAYGEQAKGAIKGFSDTFVGPSLLVYSYEDPISPAKVLSKFKKEIGDAKFHIKGGCFEANTIDAKGVETLSSMPSREELLSQLLRLISTPATQLVRLLAAPATQVTRVVDERRKQLEA